MDEDVASAIAHWAPRFTVNGVTVGDFQRITSGLEQWSQWCQAWSAVAGEHAELGARAADQGRELSAASHFAQASVYYHFAKFVFVDDLEQMKTAHEHAVACHGRALPHLVPSGRRVNIPFESGRLVGVLRLPAGKGPHPTVIMLPGLDSTKEELQTTEDTFLARGLATFSVDGPGQGESEYTFPIRADWSAPAAAILQALALQPDVDGAHLGVWGVSLGGYYSVCVAAALGERITACVSLSGPFDFGACWDGLPRLSRRTFKVRSWATDEDHAKQLAETLSLEGRLSGLNAPLLVVAGRKDRLFPSEQAEHLVASAGDNAELLMLEEGNHGCANVAPWHRPFTADWLATKLGTAPQFVHAVQHGTPMSTDPMDSRSKRL
jgi:dipeptidyl aminopeptidase/acylaminoacyl peptidase